MIQRWPITNTHLHLPPNFSAFATVEDAVTVAAAEGAAAIGLSNFFGLEVYGRFRDAAVAAGVRPLFGLEFITLDAALAERGVLVNDPANPGRLYLTGKGINPFGVAPPAAAATAAAIRRGNDERAELMVNRLTAYFQALGFDLALSAAGIAADVARRAGVPAEWVSLQERHLARALHERLATLPPAERDALVERAFGGPPTSPFDAAAAYQGELRARLLKAGKPGFAPEVPVGFAAAYDYILALDGIPCYPTVADGVTPRTEFEASADALAAECLRRGLPAAELIPARNTAACVDEYVRAFTAAGLIVLAGTEHNTPDRLPIDPAAADGPLSDYAREHFYRGACVVAAHQQAVAEGRPGFVGPDGAPAGAIADFARQGDRLLNPGGPL
ncbi:MAG: hypothetical protein LBR33_07010 [Propionibacteriaceae bacterium]|jgi:hypothetical protein|nr:hypothetical protein [Propionibacteriaceae bacterium]